MLKRLKIRFTNQDENIQIPLGGTDMLNGLTESVDEFVEEQRDEAINETVDRDVTRFRTTGDINIDYQFSDGGVGFDTTLENAGFTPEELGQFQPSSSRSFYIYQIFDQPDSDTQRKLHTGYFNGFRFIPINSGNTQYTITSDFEVSDIYLPNDFLTGGTTIFPLYMRTYFYNAKSGALQIFFNLDQQGENSELKLYFEYQFNLSNKTYTPEANMVAREIVNQEYSDIINNTLDSFTDEKPTPPSGNAFTQDGTYIDIT
jgi:hypothetical protein